MGVGATSTSRSAGSGWLPTLMLESMLNALAAKGAIPVALGLARHFRAVRGGLLGRLPPTGPIAPQARYIALRRAAPATIGFEVAGKATPCRLVTLVEENECIPEPV